MKLVVALVVLYILYLSGEVSYKVLQQKTSTQLAINDSVEKWKQSYKALQVVKKEWDGKYHPAKSIPDIRAVIGLINLPQTGLEADTDNLYLVSATQVQHGGIDIGLTKICLGITNEVFVVKAGSYKSLLAGIETLAKRDDIHIGNISVQGNLAKPQAQIGSFCLFLRNQ